MNMVDNQHKKITGYRDLSQDEIARMNRIKELDRQVGELWREVNAHPATADGAVPDGNGVDKRSLALARTHLETGFMWFVRSIAQPTSTF